MDLQTFNAAGRDELLAFLAPCAPIPDWAASLADGRPYATREAVLRDAAELTLQWSDADVDASLAHHPRIGDRVEAAGAEGDHSRREQGDLGADPGTAEAWVAANRAYEERFDRIFLIRAAGRTPGEMLESLRERLGNDDAVEARVRARELAEIALFRLGAQLDRDVPGAVPDMTPDKTPDSTPSVP